MLFGSVRGNEKVHSIRVQSIYRVWRNAEMKGARRHTHTHRYIYIYTILYILILVHPENKVAESKVTKNTATAS